MHDKQPCLGQPEGLSCWSDVHPIRLEERFMFDAAGAATGRDAAQDTAARKEADNAQGASSEPDVNSDADMDVSGFINKDSVAGDRKDIHSFDLADPQPGQTRREVMFVDARVDNIAAILAAVADNIEVHVLSENASMADLADILDSAGDVDAIHIVSHGVAGGIVLGGQNITAEKVSEMAGALDRIGSNLKADGDILLYGCDIAKGAEGAALLSLISALTQADIAASSDVTGTGGNWILEEATGSIETRAGIIGNPSVVLAAAPNIGNLNGDKVNFTEGDSPVYIDASQDLTVTDADSANFNGGSLVIAFTSNYDPDDDRLRIDTSGPVSATNGLASGSGISVGGQMIATVTTSDLANGQFVLSLTANATSANMQAFMRVLQYENNNTETIEETDRQIGFQISDDNNVPGNTAYVTISVKSVNNVPTLNGANGGGLFKPNGTPVVIDGDMTVSDPEHNDNGNYTDASLTIKRDGCSCGNADDVFSAMGNLGTLTEGSDLLLSGIKIGEVDTNSAGVLIIIFGSNATQARVNEAIQSIAYANQSGTPPSEVQLKLSFTDAADYHSQTDKEVTGTVTINIDVPVDADAFIPPVVSDRGGEVPVSGAGTMPEMVPDGGAPIAGHMSVPDNTGDAVDSSVTGQLGDTSAIGQSSTPVASSLQLYRNPANWPVRTQTDADERRADNQLVSGGYHEDQRFDRELSVRIDTGPDRDTSEAEASIATDVVFDADFTAQLVQWGRDDADMIDKLEAALREHQVPQAV